MAYFYAELRNGEEKDEALRLAQLKFVGETQDPVYRHPHFWAGFVVTGDTEALSSKWPAWIITALVLAGLGVFMVVKRKRSRSAISTT